MYENYATSLSIPYAIETPEGPVTGRCNMPFLAVRNPSPLLIAIHGGSYTAGYFDLPGHSLLAVAARQNLPIIALDRPGYGGSAMLERGPDAITRTAERLEHIIGHIWQSLAASYTGVVVIGHSIGAAISVVLAARQPDWPLLGVAISGVGVHPAPGSGEAWAKLPDEALVSMPVAIKNAVMFGPAGTYEPTMPQMSHQADALTPRDELIDIVTRWQEAFPSLAASVQAPLHYRQAEFDNLWVVNEEEIARFSACFTHTPSCDARIYRGAGHCIDFHYAGEALQLEQLAFALRCSIAATHPQ